MAIHNGIKITMLSQTSDQQVINISYTDGAFNEIYEWRFVATRDGAWKITIGDNVYANASNFYYASTQDLDLGIHSVIFGGGSPYVIIYSNTITGQYVMNLLSNSMTSEIVTVEVADVFDITNISTTQALVENPNTHVRHTLSLGGTFVYPVTINYGASGVKVAANASEVWFEYPRYTAGLPSDINRSVSVTDSTV